ncbi:MAG TPA: hypothetical protein VFQ71_14720 [Gaiellales bacterium]|nr:hypothetical protein [Gaiellales bacterium]
MSAAVPALESGGDLVEDGRFAVAEAAGYAYHLYVQPGDGRRRRWRGRVVRIDPSGERNLLPWRANRSQEDLLGRLWDETVRDLQALVGSGTPIEIVQHG